MLTRKNMLLLALAARRGPERPEIKPGKGTRGRPFCKWITETDTNLEFVCQTVLYLLLPGNRLPTVHTADKRLSSEKGWF